MGLREVLPLIGCRALAVDGLALVALAGRGARLGPGIAGLEGVATVLEALEEDRAPVVEIALEPGLLVGHRRPEPVRRLDLLEGVVGGGTLALAGEPDGAGDHRDGGENEYADADVAGHAPR
jgi:hypothetical protein